MDGAAGTERRGPWAFLLLQSRSPSMILPALGMGLAGAAITGVAVGFGENDDPTVGQIRMVAPLLTGVVAGLVGRGIWGWVAASVGAAIGIAWFTLSEQDPATGLLGGLLLSLPVLAPGYGLARALAYVGKLWSLSPRGRSAAVRGPLRRLLRAGVLVAGGSWTLVAIALSASREPSGFVQALAGAGALGSYSLYRLVDRLDRGERLAAVAFTVVFVPLGIVASGLIVAARQPEVALAGAVVGMSVVIVPILFMAFGPWVLVRIAEMQQVPTTWPMADVVPAPVGSQHPPLAPPPAPPEPGLEGPAPGPPAGATTAPEASRRQRLPSSTAIAGLAAVGCLALAIVWFAGSPEADTRLAPKPAALPHDAPEVEELLPGAVAGRPLAAWSVRGEATLRLWGMTPDEIRATSETLAASGVDLDDIVQATAGRSDVGADPPYFVLAFRIPEAARDLLGGHALFASGFTRDTNQMQLDDRIVGGRSVSVGPLDLLVQNDHQRGRPYLYGSTALDMSFIVITDDEDWAAEAISELPE